MLLSVADDDALRLRLQGSDVVDQLAPVAVPGEPFRRLGVHLVVDDDRLSLIHHLQLGDPFLDLAADGALRLVTDEHQGGVRLVAPVLQVLHDRPAVHHAASGQHDARLGLVADLLPHLRGLDPLEDVGKERVLPHLEYLRPQLGVEIFRIGGMDGGGLEDHAIKVDRPLVDLACAHLLLDDQHDLLGTPDGEHRDQDPASIGEGALDDALQSVGRIDPGGLDIMVPAIGGFDDHRFQPGELVGGGVEKPGALELHVAGEGDVVKTVADMEVADRGAEDMASVLERQTHIRRDVGGLAILQRDAVLHDLTHIIRGEGHLPVLSRRHLDRIQQEQRHEVAGWRCAIYRALVAIFVKRRQQAAVVDVSVGDYDAVQAVQWLDLRGIEVGLGRIRCIDAAVDEHLALLGGKQRRGTPHFPVAAEGGDADPPLPFYAGTGQAASYLLQEILPLRLHLGVAQVVANVRDGLRRDGRRPDDLRRPTDLLLDLVEDRPLLSDDQAGGHGLDRHFTGLGLEVDVGDLRLCRDDLPDALLHRVGVGQHGRVRTDRHALAQPLGQLPHDVVVRGEHLDVLCVDDHYRPFKIDRSDVDVRRHYLSHLLPGLVENPLSAHSCSLGKFLWR
ncbi:MAG: hypothetical protein A4E32_01633 [Methanomassiliicoccales archaeon PtaU1.Bin124]|nr:MAG: hypothetical protein A4E32_01633 [Methanomassiliicoccales archaeon PtaU1.Bin124]